MRHHWIVLGKSKYFFSIHATGILLYCQTFYAVKKLFSCQNLLKWFCCRQIPKYVNWNGYVTAHEIRNYIRLWILLTLRCNFMSPLRYDIWKWRPVTPLLKAPNGNLADSSATIYLSNAFRGVKSLTKCLCVRKCSDVARLSFSRGRINFYCGFYNDTELWILQSEMRIRNVN